MRAQSNPLTHLSSVCSINYYRCMVILAEITKMWTNTNTFVCFFLWRLMSCLSNLLIHPRFQVSLCFTLFWFQYWLYFECNPDTWAVVPVWNVTISYDFCSKACGNIKLLIFSLNWPYYTTCFIASENKKYLVLYSVNKYILIVQK